MMPPLEEVEPVGDRNVGKRHGTSARTMSAGVRSTTEARDNGEEPDVNELLADLMHTVGTMENGRELVQNWFRNVSAKAGLPAMPDTR